jgi:hypothetical protein
MNRFMNVKTNRMESHIYDFNKNVALIQRLCVYADCND